MSQRNSHLLLQAGDERAGIKRQIVRLVMGGALRIEVGRQVFVGVAVAVRAEDPDLLAAQLVAQRSQSADLVGDAVDVRGVG
jgi:hypothetical protein